MKESVIAAAAVAACPAPGSLTPCTPPSKIFFLPSHTSRAPLLGTDDK